MPLDYKQLVINDFTGGITDKYINANLNEYKTADNFIIVDRGLALRPGYRVLYDRETSQRIMGMWDFDDVLMINRGQSLYRFDAGSLISIAPPSASAILEYSGDDVYPNAVEWRDQLYMTNTGQESPVAYSRPVRIWKNDAGNYEAGEIGLPQFDGSAVNVTPNTPGSNNYVYAIHHSYEYKVGSTTFRSVSTTYQTEVIGVSSEIGSGGSVTLTGLPILTSARIDVASVKKEIYRTIKDGTVLYRVGEIANGDTVFTDTFDDDTIQNNNIPIYTANGIVEEYQPPRCKYMIIVNDTAYFLAVTEELNAGDEIRPYSFAQSVPGSPNGYDPATIEDVDDIIMGGSHVNGLPIVMTKSYIYRIEGVIDAFGNGVVRKRVISDTIGCLSHNSIVRTGKGVFWAGNNGFYVTDGYDYTLLTDLLEETYEEISKTTERGQRITGTYDDKNERIIWAISDNDTENNKLFILDIKTLRFTTASGRQFFASALTFFNKELVRGDEAGYIYNHAEDEASDKVRDTDLPADQWEKAHIPFKFESVAWDFNNPHIRKWVQAATISTKSSIPASYRPVSNNDDGAKTKDMKEVRIGGTWVWRDPNFYWKDPDITWRLAETQSKTRHFPRASMRCRRKQIALEPVEITRFRSDVLGEAEISYVNIGDPSQYYVDIQPGVRWPVDITDDKILFAENNYQTEYLILERTDTRLKIIGDTNITVGTNKAWHLKGFRRSQRMELKAISMRFAYLDNVGDKYRSTEDGDNA